jgi:hypothetical protein
VFDGQEVSHVPDIVKTFVLVKTSQELFELFKQPTSQDPAVQYPESCFTKLDEVFLQANVTLFSIHSLVGQVNPQLLFCSKVFEKDTLAHL